MLSRPLARCPSVARLALASLVATLVATALVLPSSALAAAPEAPILESPSISTGATSSEAVFHLYINPFREGEMLAPYELLYAKGASCKGEGKTFEGLATGSAEEYLTAKVPGLLPNTEYTACLVLHNVAMTEEASSALVPFMTTPGAETKPATEVLTASAKLEGTLATEGGEVEYWFSYNQGPKCTGSSAKVIPASPKTGKGTVSEPVSELLPGTQYSYCLIAHNAGGETVGNQESFTTTPVAPKILEASVLSVSSTAAKLAAQVNPGGTNTKYKFEYDTSPYTGPGEHGQSVTGDAGEGAVPQTLEADVQGLTPGTVYYFRLVLESTAGTALGEDETFTTQTTSSPSALIDNRTWELVSPPNKHGSLLSPLTENGGVIQASADGGSFTYVAFAPVTEQPAGSRSFQNTQLFSTRTSSGWSTQDITTPHEAVQVVPAGNPSEYKFFSEDLSAGIVEPEGVTPLSTLTTERTPYRAEAGQGDCPGRPPIVPAPICYQPLVTAANVPEGTKFGGVEEERRHLFSEGVTFVTATPDLSHVVLSSRQVLTEGFTPGFSSKKGNLYELSLSGLRLVSVLPANGTEPERPAAETGRLAVVGLKGRDMRGAISSDGTRVVFESGLANGTETHLYVRDMALGQTVQLDLPQEGAPGGSGEAEFQVASSDASKVFFTTHEEQLTATPPAQTEGRDLYMCEVVPALEAHEGNCSKHLVDLSVDVNPGEHAEVAGSGGEVSAVDASGRLVYFTASGVLTTEPNTRGETAVPGNCTKAQAATASEEEEACNMYVYDTVSRRIHLAAVLAGADQPDWGFGPRTSVGSLTVRSSPDGRYFAFMSDRPLTGYDNTDVNEQEIRPGEGKKHADEEVFVYNSQTEGLSCVSCDPSGARPHGVFEPSEKQTPTILVDQPRGWPERWLAGSIPGWTLIASAGGEAALRQPRYLFDSGRMFFDSADGLVGQDGNGVEDVYEYEPQGVPSGERACSSATSSGSSTYKPERTYKVEGREGTEPAGCVGLISSGTSSEESAFLEASEGHGQGETGGGGRGSNQEGGDNVFFLTAARLSPLDVDSALDVYDAHVCGAGGPCPSIASPPPVCEGDACQTVVAPPSESTPGSLTFSGPGNLTPTPSVKPTPPPCSSSLGAPAKGCTKKQNLTKALTACKRKYPHNKKRRSTCERAARKAYGAKTSRHAARK